MKETEYLETIKKVLADSSLIGDDCAFLTPDMTKNNGLYITQDSLVEDVHFKLSTTTPYQLGKKSVSVNLSDLAAVCAEPLYITVSLSLPKRLNEQFVKDIYRGVNEICERYNVKVAGGDLTGSDKLFISICAIGRKTGEYNISRKNAKPGDIIVVTGCHGDSAGGLSLLEKNDKSCERLICAHLEPLAQIEKSKVLSNLVNQDFAMMDTSDGLADALYKIAHDSGVLMEVDFEAIPVSEQLREKFPDTYKSFVLWGGEDYQLLLCIKPEIYKKLDKDQFFKIGTVQKADILPVVRIKDNDILHTIDLDVFDKKSFNHFGDK